MKSEITNFEKENSMNDYPIAKAVQENQRREKDVECVLPYRGTNPLSYEDQGIKKLEDKDFSRRAVDIKEMEKKIKQQKKEMLKLISSN